MGKRGRKPLTSTERYRTDPEYRRRKLLQRITQRHGLPVEIYHDILTAQDGVCAICQEPSRGGRRLAVDHCHETGRIRGLLCWTCNTALGLFRDKTDNLLRAKAYLERKEI